MGLLPVDRLGGRSANRSAGAVAVAAPSSASARAGRGPTDIAEPLHRHYKRRRPASPPPPDDEMGYAHRRHPTATRRGAVRPHVLRRVQAPAAGHRPGRDPGLARLARPGRRPGGRDPRPVPPLQAAQARPPAPDRAAAADPDALHQHDQPRAGAGLPGRRGDRAAHPPDDPLERGGDGPAREQPLLGHRRPPRDVRVGGQPVRGRLQPLLPGQGRRAAGDQIFYQGHAAPGHLRPGVPRGPPDRGPARPLPARDRPRPGPDLLPAPAADARLLGVPDGLDGPRPDQRDLPGALQPLPPEPRHPRHDRARASGRSSATARPTSPSRSARSTSPRARASTT